MSALPSLLAEIASVAGEEAALKIASARGGTQIYVPPVPSSDHWMTRLIGQEKARAVCAQLTAGVGPRRVDLPLGPTGTRATKRAQMDRMIIDQRSERDIARATGYTQRAVRKRNAQLGKPKDKRQIPLL